MPGNPEVIEDPPVCVDAASLRWFADAKALRLNSTNTVPGITTCSPEPLSAVIPTRTTKQVLRSTLVRTG
jgi:hypothetical protein